MRRISEVGLMVRAARIKRMRTRVNRIMKMKMMEVKAIPNNNKAPMIKSNMTSSTTSNSHLNNNKLDKVNKKSKVKIKTTNNKKKTVRIYKTANKMNNNKKMRGMTLMLMKIKMNKMTNNRMINNRMSKMMKTMMNNNKSKKATPTNSLYSHKRVITRKIIITIKTITITTTKNPLNNNSNKSSNPIHKRRENSTLFNELYIQIQIHIDWLYIFYYLHLFISFLCIHLSDLYFCVN